MISESKLQEFIVQNYKIGNDQIDLSLKYITLGKLNKNKDNLIIFPTRFAGTYQDQNYLIGSNQFLNPEKYFILIPNMFGNGISSSPSNAENKFKGIHFPRISINDNVRIQKKLINEKFGIEKVFMVIGWSMGGLQAYEWGSYYSDLVERVVPICAHSKTTDHTYVFLEGMHAALTSDPEWQNGLYIDQPNAGKTTMAKVWAGWAHGQNWYREKLYLKENYLNPSEVLSKYWNNIYHKKDANNLIHMIRTWQNHDISNNTKYNKNISQALKNIKAKTLLMPGVNDLYFPHEDNKIELNHLNNGHLSIIESNYGHYAGAGKSLRDLEFINKELFRHFI